MQASPPLRGLRDRFAHPYQTWYECAVKATTIYQQGAMLAPIRLTNAGSCPSRQRDCVATAARSAETKGTAQLVLRTQVRRKETHPHHPSAPLPLSGVGIFVGSPGKRGGSVAQRTTTRAL